MILEIERLIAKEYNINEVDNYYLLQSNELVWRYSTNITTKCKEDTMVNLIKTLENYKEKDIGFHALYCKENSRFIGEAGILSFNKKTQRCVIRYNILPEFWNQRYASEITSGLVKYAFNL
ncbi:GNAT family N-acetyltransferase [Clostridium cadaveris]|nr:GNAT family N-acetyltransferase [Clostridium cadaveris]NWK11641.1 GNAT family N-acetyltransferase [Clostridium cadaveris]